MSRSEDDSGDPQAIIHKRILDVAEENPDASLEAIAETVTGAPIELVERVLKKYGDPGENAADGTETDTGTTMSEGERTEETVTDESTPEDSDGDAGVPDRSELSDKQFEALRPIEENPEATQRELAEELDVTAANEGDGRGGHPGGGGTRRSGGNETGERTGVLDSGPQGSDRGPRTGGRGVL